MTNPRFDEFINAVIEKTKSGVLSWKRVNPRKFSFLQGYDLRRSFFCSFLGGTLLLALEADEEMPQCFISPEMGLPFQSVNDIDKNNADLLRLYNLVYSLFPSVQSFMASMIELPDDPAYYDTDALPF